uniref:Uncharacterized protein n=1 Tax=Anguilla anguilla TaxID=7936 RepID=A0A0E9R3W1_ANGAN
MDVKRYGLLAWIFEVWHSLNAKDGQRAKNVLWAVGALGRITDQRHIIIFHATRVNTILLTGNLKSTSVSPTLLL